MKIKFKEPTWCVKSEGGGLTGHYNHKATLIEPVEFEVHSIEKFKKEGYSNIHVYTDGCCDGNNIFLLNIPNALYEVSDFNGKI